MIDTVRHHMVADVPVGVFLSAGIDSNVIAALAAEVTPHLSTITLAFDEYAGTADDEAPIAEAAARHLGSDHVTTRIGREEFVDLLDRFIQAMDQPTIDGLNTYLVSRCAAVQGLKVALSGLGWRRALWWISVFQTNTPIAEMGQSGCTIQIFWINHRANSKTGEFKSHVTKGRRPVVAFG